jgi:hypothetical protein
MRYCEPEDSFEYIVLEENIQGYNDFYEVDAPWIKVLTEYGTGYIPDMEAAKNIWKSKRKIVR